jgi:thiamine-phosphate pyrophosphorylase
VIQLRDKTASARQLLEEAKRLLPLTEAAGIPLIVNDRVDVARSVGADGVHLGQDDLPVEDARSILGQNRLIGKSTHTFEQACTAQAQGVDYIGLGPVFPTPTKPDYGSVGTELLRQVAPHIWLPVVCIGGINGENIQQVVEAGAKCVAVVRAICSAEDPESAARHLKETIVLFAQTP